MGKQNRKKHHVIEKKSKFEKICDRCGNENFSFKPVFKCKYCGEINGLRKENDQNA